MKKIILLQLIGIVATFLVHGIKPAEIKPDKPNVLFIAVDDLRSELGCYGRSHIKSPNIDRLARSGIVFLNSHCNYPVCGPSRASLLSGVYNSFTRFGPGYNISQDVHMPGVVSLPMHFKNNHYTTVSLGKIYHNFEDGKGSWDRIWRPPMTTTAWDYQSPDGIRIFEELNKYATKEWNIGEPRVLPKRGLPYEKPDIPDIMYNDGKIANRAIEELQNFQNSGEPFFLAVGFHKPHLPFNAPAKYWDMYDKNGIRLPANGHLAKDAPDAARFNWGELRAYYGIPDKGPLPDSLAKNLIHGYYACVSYVDAQVGLVLNALESLGLSENTIIILWGDHGWFLGEHGFWSKHSSFRRAAHAPLIVMAPGQDPGKKSNALVEFVDVYPSLCELAGLSLPFHLQGKSFVPLINKPDQQWKDAVFYRIGNAETVITNTHAYTEWFNQKNGNVTARMLYDHRNDPEENINISELPENKSLIDRLHDTLHEHLKNRDKIEL